MEITVKIKWDKPEEQAWLNADNISIALHAYCKNTKFEVKEIQIPCDADIEAWAENKNSNQVPQRFLKLGAKAVINGEIKHINQ